MEFAVIFNRSLGLENYRLFAVDGNQNIPGAVARGGGMGNKVGVDPLNSVADMCRNFSRHKTELLQLHLYGVSVRKARRSNENERAD